MQIQLQEHRDMGQYTKPKYIIFSTFLSALVIDSLGIKDDIITKFKVWVSNNNYYGIIHR